MRRSLMAALGLALALAGGPRAAAGPLGRAGGGYGGGASMPSLPRGGGIGAGGTRAPWAGLSPGSRPPYGKLGNIPPPLSATPAFGRPSSPSSSTGGAIPGYQPRTTPPAAGLRNQPSFGARPPGFSSAPPRGGIATRPGAAITTRPVSTRPVDPTTGIATLRPGSTQYYDNWHGSRWGYGCWYYGSTWPTAYTPGTALVTGAALGAAVGSSGGYSYANPYAGDTSVYDYSDPVAQPVAGPSAGATASGADSAPPADVNPGAAKAFDAARAAFHIRDYARAQQQVEAAIQLMPDDAVLHEFRALCLFAQGKYHQAAGPLYAVLAAGPPWDWGTIEGIYGDTAVYRQQLRKLEEFVRSNARDAAGHFVLAYQYMCIGDGDAAVEQLREVTRLQPKDQLSASLLKSMQQTETAAPGSSGERGGSGST